MSEQSFPYRGSSNNFLVTLIQICPLSKLPHVVDHLLFLTDKTKLDGKPQAKLNEKYIIFQGLIQPKNDNGYRFWVQNVWRPNSTYFSLSVLSKTVENKRFNYKWHNSYSKVHTQIVLCLKIKLIF